LLFEITRYFASFNNFWVHTVLCDKII